MALKERIQQDIKMSLKEKKDLEVLVLRQISAAVLNKEKDKQYKLSQVNSESKGQQEFQLTDEEVTEVIISETKKRREAIEGFAKGNRQDLLDKEKKELEILLKYLPEQLSEEEIRKMAKEAIEKLGAKEPKDIGKVMSEIMPKIRGRADGGTIGKIIKELLAL